MVLLKLQETKQGKKENGNLQNWECYNLSSRKI